MTDINISEEAVEDVIAFFEAYGDLGMAKTVRALRAALTEAEVFASEYAPLHAAIEKLEGNVEQQVERAEAAEADRDTYKKLADELAGAAAPLALQDPDYDGMWKGPCTLCHHDYRRAAEALAAYEAQVKKEKTK